MTQRDMYVPVELPSLPAEARHQRLFVEVELPGPGPGSGAHTSAAPSTSGSGGDLAQKAGKGSKFQFGKAMSGIQGATGESAVSSPPTELFKMQ